MNTQATEAPAKIRLTLTVSPEQRRAVVGIAGVRDCELADVLQDMSLNDAVKHYETLKAKLG